MAASLRLVTAAVLPFVLIAFYWHMHYIEVASALSPRRQAQSIGQQQQHRSKRTAERAAFAQAQAQATQTETPR
eukprot:CAMPEP_0174704820 /NCGR_PEP_ID=MMETSP1094-20130205/8263_1 /TAXON_ID=156173 /ORGANISM="Chrysochromulina brevifilum, Strain UTEX LB 985" /LENGTH=73 /DNA_ID=CAMNT_0015902909 /DNA_START=54 /DNA_END=271 /DNA_ORIENTATION=+